MSDLGRRITANWRAASAIEKAVFVAFLCSVAAALFQRGTSLESLAWMSAYFLGAFLIVRYARTALRAALWRLRHRLLITYAFIALVPGVLFLLLVSVVYYAFIGQLAIYVVISELERRTAQVISIAEWLAEPDKTSRRAALAESYELMAQRLPGLQMLVEDGSTWRYPADSTMQTPAKEWGDAGGLLVKDGSPYVWAHIVREGVRTTALLPVSARFLTSLAPNLGQFNLGRIDDSPGSAARPIRLHRSATAVDESAPRNRVPDPSSRFDVRVEWATLLPVYVWESPGTIENIGLSVVTRPTAVLGTVFAQRVEMAEGAIGTALYFLTGLFLLAEIASLVIGASLTRTITRAVHGLYEGTERVREGDFSHRIAVTGKDQLADLGESFNTMTANLEGLLSVAKEKERMQADLEIAREVQSQLIPKSPPDMPSIRLEAAGAPARMVSGDYYDYALIDDSRLAVAVGDVAGKGISAALLMATIQAVLRTQLRHPPVTASALVSHLNQFLYAHTAPEKYATFFLCLYDHREETLTYTNAGHLPPILLRNGVATTLDVNGIVVGAFPFARYTESRIRLEKGDLLLFYTDGATEPENAYGEQFGEQRLIEILKREQERTPREILDSLTAGVREWSGAGELQDDLTLLLARRT